MRLVPIIAPLALVASLSTPVLADNSATSPPPHAKPMNGATQKCPPGEYMVKGTTHNGKPINLYCMTIVGHKKVSHKTAYGPGWHSGATPRPRPTP